MVKVVQAFLFIARDRLMYHPDTDTPAMVRLRLPLRLPLTGCVRSCGGAACCSDARKYLAYHPDARHEAGATTRREHTGLTHIAATQVHVLCCDCCNKLLSSSAPVQLCGVLLYGTLALCQLPSTLLPCRRARAT
jgi:hypothetical protein